jgi:N-acetylneuraminic acid mutarotase
MLGSDQINQPGFYFALGRTSSAATPGARGYSAGWLGLDGRLWLFGGAGRDSAAHRAELNDLWALDPYNHQWTWMGGSSTVGCDVCGAAGVYGSRGVSAPANVPGGRQTMMYWEDNDANFWIFGGLGFDAVGQEDPLNDLWEFNFRTGQWIWWSGSDKVGPVGFQAGVYGTLDVPAAGNTPGSRTGGANWFDSDGNLWLYGGFGWDSGGANGWLSDLWRFDMALKQWAWMGGSSTAAGVSPIYGTQGHPDPASQPGSRQNPISWTDLHRHFWLFGGAGRDGHGDWRYYDDLWEFDPGLGQWTWWGGSPDLPITNGYYAAPGVYGTKGTPDPANQPGSRYFGAATSDVAGNLWLLGGFGFDVAGNPGFLNDLWEYQLDKQQWVWISGGDSVDANGGAPGSYGQFQVVAPSNVPTGRSDHPIWMDPSGRLWLFGGSDDQAKSNFGDLNDLWLYTPGDYTAPPQAATPTFSPTPGAYASAQNVTISDATPGVTIHYTADGSVPTGSSTIYSTPISVATTTTIKAFASAAGHTDSSVASGTYTITLPSAATPTFTPAAGTYAAAQSVTLADATSGAAIHYTTDGSTPTTASPVYAGPIAVNSSLTIKTMAIAIGYAPSAVTSATYTIQIPNPDFAVTVNPWSLIIPAGKSATATLDVQPSNGFAAAVSFTCSGLPAGATCSFAPPSITPLGGAKASSTVTIHTSQNSAAVRASGTGAAGILVAALFSLGWLRRRRIAAQTWLTVLLAAAFLSALCGCASYVLSGSPVTAQVLITATSGSMQRETTLTVTVK